MMRVATVPAAGCVAFAWVATALAGMVTSVAAQDIEAVAEMRGLSLPEAYYRRVAQDPMAFQLPNGLFRAGPQGVEQVRTVGGTHRVIVLPALFADSPEPHISQAMVQQALFDGPAAAGTVTEAYLEISRGELTLLGDVLPWVRTSHDMLDVVGSENGLGDDADLGPYFVEALSLSDPTVDFGLYDNDGADNVPNSGDDDGFVDAMVFEYLEISGSCGGPSIWPHRFGVAAWTGGQPYVTDDARPGGGFVQVNGYITQSVAACDGIEVQTSNTISHEYGHVLGLPDFYHPTASGGAAGRRWVLGCWELMAAGSWGCGPVEDAREPYGPSHLSSRNKNVLGWLDFTEVPLGGVIEQEYVLDPVQTSGEALRIPMDDVGAEYLLVEFRDQVGFDAALPAAGVLVFHQDLGAATRPDPASGLPYFVALLEQDDNDGLVRNSYEGGNRGEAGDAWGVGGVPDELSSLTSPSTRRNDGSVTPIVFHSIVVENGQARIVLSTEVVVETERMIRFFLDTSSVPLTDLELGYLDSEGNRNGIYDVGDLRRYLREHGGS